ncbi:hypothetical protein AcW2_000329 [Taiwanofungus camphoratus]|nr:hypothetical protein AcW2_000329 [Antrodia cinnamomea]
MRHMEANVNDLSDSVAQREATIVSLTSEKAALARVVERLKTAESKAQEMDIALHAEQNTSQVLNGRIRELEKNVQEYAGRIEQHQQTISLLVSEKASLTSSLERLQDADSKLQETQQLFQAQRSNAERLQQLVGKLEQEVHNSSETLAQLSASEKEVSEKSREQEREIQLLTGTVSDLRMQAEQSNRRVRELEEQIESDDRAERLEATLQNTQDRADELEFQLSKLQQAHNTLKIERDEFVVQLRQQADAEADWRGRHAEVEKQHAATHEQLSAVTSERDDLLQATSTLQLRVAEKENAVAELEQGLATIATQLTAGARQLQQAQLELKNANRRAEEAERIQKELQAEGVGLMRSLDEMRPKIIELTDVKLNLGEQVESLETALRSRDATVAQLETNLEELRHEKENVERQRQELSVALEKERSSSDESTAELQKAYAGLQSELEETRAIIHDLESERTNYHQMADRHFAEVDRLTSSLQSHMEQLASLRNELDERQRAQDEAQDFLERAHGETEALRAELLSRGEEIERLREAASLPSTPGPHSLDEEMLSALKQQHSLEMSTAQSHMRTLETSVFQADARAHALQKQVAALEDQLAHLRSSSRTSQRSQLPQRPLSRNVDHSDDLRRASFTSHRPSSHLAPPSNLPSFDGLTPETRHKRRVSLGMLKARIDSEVAASSTASRPSSRIASHGEEYTGLPTVVEPGSRSGSPHSQVLRKPQFLDDAHIFWCHSCQGDLVIL